MKTIKKISAILRTVGIVLLCLALVTTIYVAASYGALWSNMSKKLAASGTPVNIVTKMRFDRSFYGAMSAATGSRAETTANRAKAIEPYFASFAAQGMEGETRLREAMEEAILTGFEEAYDYEAFLERYGQMENLEEARELREIFEYLDSFGMVKKGKLKAASCDTYFQQYYADFAAEHGEEAGTYLEFMTTVKAMVEAYVAEGNTLKAAKDYMSDGFTYEAYTEGLNAVRSAEKQAVAENLLDDFAVLAEARVAGEAADVRALLESTSQRVQAKYPNEDLGGWSVFLSSVEKLLAPDNTTFDGSYSALVAEMRAQAVVANENSISTFISAFCRDVVVTADGSSSIGVMGFVWAVVAQYMWLWIAGVLLIIAAKVLTAVLTKRLLAKREKAGIQEDPDVLLRVSHLKQYFRSGDYVNKAVDDVSFYVKRGEVFGLVGESGCGKTTTGRTIIHLYDPTEGDVYFEGLRISSTQNGLPVLTHQLRKEHEEQVTKLKEKLEEEIKQHPDQAAKLRKEHNAEVKRLAAALAQRIEKARDAALESSVEQSKANEIYRERRQAALTQAYEADMKNLTGAAAQERKKRYETEMQVAAKDNIMTKMQMIFQDPIASINPRMTVREIIAEGLEIRGIRDKAYIDKKVYEMLELVGLVPEHADRYPHEFSGGQRQRIGIARAIVMEPDLIIADEPISALDVSIQAQVINLLNDLRNKMGLTIMFIAHNLSVVKYFSDRIAVMYYGKIVEMTTSDELFAHPLHPYTKALLSAIPYPDPHYEKTRKRIEYNPTLAHDYSVDKPSLREITPGHYIHCNDVEFKRYQEELGL